MSTTVTYKGSTLTTVSNDTATLETAGTWMEDDLTLVDVSQSAPVLQTKSETYTPSTSQQTDQITADVGYDGLDEVNITVNAVQAMTLPSATSSTSSGTSKATVSRSTSDQYLNIPTGYNGTAQYYKISATPNGTATPASSISATGATVSTGTNTLTLSKSVSNTPQVSEGYISSGTAGNSSVSLTASVNTRDSSDLSASGPTVTAPAGYYGSSASKTVASGTEGTPTATKGAVSSHSIAVTPSVTNAAGYISGGTHTGTAVSVSASELVSGTYTVDSSGTKDVTNYASASVPSGTAGTPTATKGAVNNHSVSVTPSVTNTTGWITGSTKTGTAVTVSASELVSGNKAITSNGSNIDVTEYATVSVNVSGGGGAISVVDTLDANGGTIRTITAVDTSSVTAVASDVASGKYFIDSSGTLTAGTASGSGNWAWYAMNGELIQSGSDTIALEDTDYATWTPSTTAATIYTVTTTDITKDSNYRYVYVFRFLSDFVYDSNFTQTLCVNRNIAIYTMSNIQNPANVAYWQSGSSLTGNAMLTNQYNAMFWKNSSGVDSFNQSQFGLYINAQTPSNTGSKINCGFNVVTRCSTSYHTTTAAAAVDQEASTFTYQYKIYRVPIATSVTYGMVDDAINIYRNGIS